MHINCLNEGKCLFECVRNYFVKLMCSKLKETKKTWQLNAIPDSRLDLALEGKNASQDTMK